MYSSTRGRLRRSRVMRALLSRTGWCRPLLLFFVLSILEAQLCQFRLGRAAQQFHRAYALPVLSEAAERDTPPSSSAVTAQRHAPLAPRPRPRARVFIASLFWNNAAILQSEWISRAVQLVRLLGPENVFVSVYESGSVDNTKEQLWAFRGMLEELAVANHIVMENVSHVDLLAAAPDPALVPTDQIMIGGSDARGTHGTDGAGVATGATQPADSERAQGWIRISSKKKHGFSISHEQQQQQIAPRRIPYLAGLRNLSLQPLRDLDAQGAAPFDYVLFLGDVVFSEIDVLALLDTNGGEYAAACSLDFNKPPSYYDTFALRDSDRHGHANPIWPYFRAAKSRDALKRSEPVPVTSCWNGIVAMPASSFTGRDALAFRSIDDSLARAHLEGSECCLIHADNPASSARGVFLNPNVRVGYSREAFDAVHRGGGGDGGSWLPLFSIWKGLWLNRLARWLTSPGLKEAYVRRTVAHWVRQNAAAGVAVAEPGADFCLINEMQVLAWDGWAHA